MMRAALSFIVILGLAALTAALANLPGQVTIALGAWVVEMRLAVLAGLVLSALLVALAALALANGLVHWPSRWRAARRAKQTRVGEAALADALMALARGDAAAAARATGLAREKLPHQALPRLMAAQAALLDGRAEDAAADYHAMLEPDTTLGQKILGLEGLYYIARAAGDADHAGQHALQVLEIAPKTGWALDGMMTLAVQIGDWEAAQQWLRRWSRAGAKRGAVKRRRAVLLLAQAQHLLVANDPGGQAAAQKLADRAHALDKDFIAAACLAAELSAASGDLKKARKMLRGAFARAPHAALADAWLRCHADQSLAGKQRAVTAFIGPHKDHVEAHVLRARIALDGERWRLARTLLAPHAEAADASRQLCRLMADAEAGLNEPAEAQYWHDRARRAPGAAGWMAGGLRLDEWQAVCPVTGRLDAVVWQAPQEGLPAGLALPGAAMSEAMSEAMSAAPALDHLPSGAHAQS